MKMISLSDLVVFCPRKLNRIFALLVKKKRINKCTLTIGYFQVLMLLCEDDLQRQRGHLLVA
jgi:hypothetical protein